MPGAGDDPFPRERFTSLLGRLPRYARLAWRLGRDERIAGPRRAALLAGAAYLASPIDLVPGIVPVAGQLDDAAAILFALRVALDGLPAEQRRAELAGVDLAEDDLGADLAVIGATYAWLARRGGRLAWRGVRGAVRTSGRVGAAVARRLRRR